MPDSAPSSKQGSTPQHEKSGQTDRQRSLTSLRHFVPGQLLEVTMRCFQSRFLLLPTRGPELEQIFLGALGKAQQRYGMKVCFFAVLSNHLHLALLPDDKDQLEGFQRYLASNLSRKVGRFRGWTGGIFRHRYSSVPVTDEPEAEVARLAYQIAQSMKEKLCPRSDLWIGPHAIKPLLRGEFEVKGGVWTNHTALCEARREYQRFRAADSPRIRRERPRPRDFQTPVTVHLSKIPCWRHLSDESYLEAIRELLEAKQAEHAEEIAQVPENWQARILAQNPRDTPHRTSRRPKPFCHAATKAAREQFRAMKTAWINAYAAASERFRQGLLEAIAEFPDNSYLPRFGRLPEIPVTTLQLPPDTS